MKQLLFAAASILFLLWSGCSSSPGIRVIETTSKEVFLSFPKGADVKVGDVFVLYRTQESASMGGQHDSHGGHAGHGGTAGTRTHFKQEIGRVQVIEIVDEAHASVKLLSGSVEDGLKAEKGE